MDTNLKLSRYFTLGELIRSNHRTIPNIPTQAEIDRLSYLCINFLDPIRERFGPIWVTSGFRCVELNTAIGGARDSAHMYGCAADLNPVPESSTVDGMFNWVANESNLLFDQVINEKAGTSRWLHIGMLRPNHEIKPRGEVLTFNDGKYVLLKKV